MVQQFIIHILLIIQNLDNDKTDDLHNQHNLIAWVTSFA